MRKRLGAKAIGCAAGIVMMLFAGCGGGVDIPEDGPDRIKPNMMTGNALVGYESCDQLEAEVKEVFILYVESLADYYKNTCRSSSDSDVGDTASEVGSSRDSSDSSDPTYTTTNVQERGVDEPDLIKTDGKHVFAIVDKEIEIRKVWPFDSFQNVSTLQPKGTPNGLHLFGNKLIVTSTEYACSSYYCNYETYANNPDVFHLEIFDVSDPSNPVVVSEESYDGKLIDSRMIGSRLNIAIGGKVVWPQLDFENISYYDLSVCDKNGESTPSQQLLTKINNFKNKNIATINALELGDIVLAPDVSTDAACQKISRSHASFGTEIMTILSADVEDSKPVTESKSILGNRGTVYSSAGNMYLASTAKPFYMMFFSGDEFDEEMVVHRFLLAGGAPRYLNTFSAKGTILGWGYSSSNSWCFSNGQFAMDEHDGHFRMATTQFNFQSEEEDASQSLVTVFKVDAQSTVKVGEVDGLGKGEMIYSVRFDGDKGYVVTFRQVDPFYVIDLSNPSTPKVAGELKMPGFSSYIHPLDENRIIALGYIEAEDGWTLKLALFDVTDPSNPVEAGNRIIGTGGTYSPAAWHHHAFTLDRSRGILSLPLKTWNFDKDDWSVKSSAGTILLNVDEKVLFETIGEVVLDESETWGDAFDVFALRTILIGDGENEGVITLTTEDIHLNLIDENMTPVELK